MEYSIYKDSTVNATVDRIKNILKDLNIDVSEHFNKYPISDIKMPYSLSLCFYDEMFASNGKGTTLENARASAYAEFMERLQNNQIKGTKLFFSKFMFAPDENRSAESVNKFILNYYDYKYYELFHNFKNDDRTIYTVPFYNLKEKTLYEIPLEFLWHIQGTNGMCAGNTPEEAIVQGLSEIYERCSTKEVLLNNISMPDIPEEVWGKYERIKELKEYIEKYGYEVSIKDASLGKKLPVVCTIFKNKKEGFYGMRFGAQPSLPIAIERTFTEFMQGGIPDCKSIKLLEDESVYEIDRLYVYKAIITYIPIINVNQDKSLYNLFFVNKPDYEFSLNAWVDENKNYTNKELLKFLIENVRGLSDYDIYVRDVSFCGFPSYYIYIPNLSEGNILPLEIYEKKHLFESWESYTNDKNNQNTQNIDSLISALDFKINYLDFEVMDKSISPLANEYLLLLCYIVKNDVDNVVKYCDIILNSDKIQKKNNRFEIIRDYFNSQKSIQGNIREKYSKEEIERFEMFISHLSFSQIKQIINDTNNKYLQKQKEDFYNSDRLASKDLDNKIDIMRKNIEEKYINNSPNQMDLSKVFDFV